MPIQQKLYSQTTGLSSAAAPRPLSQDPPPPTRSNAYASAVYRGLHPRSIKCGSEIFDFVNLSNQRVRKMEISDKGGNGIRGQIGLFEVVERERAEKNFQRERRYRAQTAGGLATTSGTRIGSPLRSGTSPMNSSRGATSPKGLALSYSSSFASFRSMSFNDDDDDGLTQNDGLGADGETDGDGNHIHHLEHASHSLHSHHSKKSLYPNNSSKFVPPPPLLYTPPELQTTEEQSLQHQHHFAHLKVIPPTPFFINNFKPP
jgi:hypothetical protein